MATKKPLSEDKFIKSQGIAEIYARAKELEPGLWNELQKIAKHYQEYSQYCEAIVQREVLEILKKTVRQREFTLRGFG